MNKKLLLTLISIAVFTFVVIFFVNRRHASLKSNPQENGQILSAAKEPKRHTIKAQNILNKPILPANLESLIQKNSTDIPPACLEHWQQVAMEDVSKIEFGTEQLEPSPKCREQELATLPQLLFETPEFKTCQKFKEEIVRGVDLNDPKSKEGKAKCNIWFASYRSQVIEKMTGHSDPMLLDAPTLVNKMWARIGNGSIKSEDLTYNLNLADALIEKEPDLYAAYKAKVLFMIAGMLDGSVVKPEDFEHAIKNAEMFDVDDPQLIEAMIVSKRKDSEPDNKTYKEFLNEEIAANPQSSIPNYYLAQYHWARGEKEVSIQILEDLVKKSPADTRFSSTLEKLQKARPAEKGMFRFDISVTFQDL